MGYQLNMLTLWVTVPLLVIPTYGLVLPAASATKSLTTSGGRPYLHMSHFPLLAPPTIVCVQTGASPLGSITPSPLRSAGSCRITIAFGFTGLAPGPLGGAVPRAKPRRNHSSVTSRQLPATSLYRTLSHPSIKFQVAAAGSGYGSALFTR